MLLVYLGYIKQKGGRQAAVAVLLVLLWHQHSLGGHHRPPLVSHHPVLQPAQQCLLHVASQPCCQGFACLVPCRAQPTLETEQASSRADLWSVPRSPDLVLRQRASRTKQKRQMTTSIFRVFTVYT